MKNGPKVKTAHVEVNGHSVGTTRLVYANSFFKAIASPPVFGTAIFGLIATLCGMICFRLDKKVPVNYILLLVFTLCESVLVGMICMTHQP